MDNMTAEPSTTPEPNQFSNVSQSGRTPEEDLREKLAAIEHERWADWQQWVHDTAVRSSDGSLTILASNAVRWQEQIDTPYDQLSEGEKASDREQVDRYWPLIQEYVRLRLHSSLNHAPERTTAPLPSGEDESA